jgi:DNA-binding SARP family transcriptional activator
MKNKVFSSRALFLLGNPRLVKDGTDQTKALKYRKGWALLGYLVTHADQWQSREKLADLLWPDLDLPAARTNLRQVLSNLWGLLTDGEGHCALERNDRAVRWAAGSDVWLDLQLLSNESLAKAGSVEAIARHWRIHDLQPHLKALSGPFLENVELVGAVEYEHWQQSIREFYRSRSLLLLEQASLSQQVTGHIDDAILSATQLLDMEPCDESYVLRLMDLLAGQGRKAEAIAVFERTKQAMQELLGARPGASVVARRDALLQEAREQDDLQAEVASELRWVAALYADFQNQVTLDEFEDDAQRVRFSETAARFGGQVFPTVGAGVFAVFGLAGVGERVAFRALLSAQDVMAWGQPLGARMGICCGKVLFRRSVHGATISGDVSDMAMRICLTAEPGQVLLSAQAAQQIGRAAILSDGGEWRFRGFEGLHALARWTAVWRRSG